MSQHGIEQFVIAEAVFCRPSCSYGSVFLRSRSRTPMPISAISFFSSSRDGGVSRYRITVGSAPLLRISAEVLQDVPQAGLW